MAWAIMGVRGKLHIAFRISFTAQSTALLTGFVPPLTWYGLDNTHGKAYDTAHQGTYQAILRLTPAPWSIDIPYRLNTTITRPKKSVGISLLLTLSRTFA